MNDEADVSTAGSRPFHLGRSFTAQEKAGRSRVAFSALFLCVLSFPWDRMLSPSDFADIKVCRMRQENQENSVELEKREMGREGTRRDPTRLSLVVGDPRQRCSACLILLTKLCLDGTIRIILLRPSSPSPRFRGSLDSRPSSTPKRATKRTQV